MSLGRPLSYGVVGNALRAMELFHSMTNQGFGLDHLDLDRADLLVARVEQFVKAYRKVHGWAGVRFMGEVVEG